MDMGSNNALIELIAKVRKEVEAEMGAAKGDEEYELRKAKEEMIYELSHALKEMHSEWDGYYIPDKKVRSDNQNADINDDYIQKYQLERYLQMNQYHRIEDIIRTKERPHDMRKAFIKKIIAFVKNLLMQDQNDIEEIVAEYEEKRKELKDYET